jgi:uncharacterized protein (DUF433 family)
MRRKTPKPEPQPERESDRILPATPRQKTRLPAVLGRGQPPHRPTRHSRRTVVAWAQVGRTQDEIAAKLRIDTKTLREHYRMELDTALPEANAKVGGKLYSECKRGNMAAIKWWEQTRAKMVPAMAVYATVDDRTMSSSDAKARFLQGVMNLIAADQIEGEQRPPDEPDPGVPKVIDVTPEPEQDDGDGVME